VAHGFLRGAPQLERRLASGALRLSEQILRPLGLEGVDALPRPLRADYGAGEAGLGLEGVDALRNESPVLTHLD
jgi:hypothetical protein